MGCLSTMFKVLQRNIKSVGCLGDSVCEIEKQKTELDFTSNHIYLNTSTPVC